MAEKKVVNFIKLQIPAGAANPAPPIGPALGAAQVNIMQFCQAFNAETADKKGDIIPVEISVYEDRSFSFICKTPPAAELFTPSNVASLAFLAVVCSFGCLALLNYGLTKVDPAEGSLLSSLESPSGVAFSVAFGYESLTPKLLIGFALIFVGIVLSELGDKLFSLLPSGRKGRSASLK